MDISPSPQRQRPTMPDGYGLPSTTDDLLKWDDVQQRLRTAQHYWLATVRPDGSPHSVPRWGVWVDNHFYYDGAATTRITTARQRLAMPVICAVTRPAP